MSQVANEIKSIKSDYNEASKQASAHHEGILTRMTENWTSELPSGLWLGLAVGSMVASAGLEIFGKKKEYGNFVGMWAPCFLLMGIYNKLVKEEKSFDTRKRHAS